MSESAGSEGSQAAAAAETSTRTETAREVFVSYASQDAELAEAVVAALESNNITCWIAPRDVVPGARYADDIIRAITAAKVFVLALSQHSIASHHVGREVERAASKGRPIITLRIDEASLNTALEYFLSESQWIDAQGQSVAALDKLVDAVRRHLDGFVDKALLSSLTSNARPASSPDKGDVTLQPKSRHWMAYGGAIALLLVVLGYAVAERGRRGALLSNAPAVASSVDVRPGSSAAPAIAENSVAVLPFVDMSEKKDQEYFSDGLSEELIDMLTRVADLRVPARTSSFYFKGKSEDVPTIAKRLLVAHVLEGSVRKSGSHLRITAQLVRADTGYHVWSQTFDREVDDIFKVQDEIAGAVVKALKISLSGNEQLVAAPTANPDAYLLYLKGLALFRNGNEVGSVAPLRESLKLDAAYAPAWALLARALRLAWGQDEKVTFSDASPAIRRAAERAVQLDPKLPEAQIALAAADLVDWRWGDADEAIKKGLDLDPNNVVALRLASTLASIRGQGELALSYSDAALTRDPLEYHTIENVVVNNMYLGRYVVAENLYRANLQINPEQSKVAVHSSFAAFKFYQGDVAGALSEIEPESDEAARLYWRIRCLDALGRKSEAEQDFAIVIQKYAAIQPYTIAALYASRRDGDRAFEWLERAYLRRDPALSENLKLAIYFRPFHLDPRYKAMLQKLNLAD